MKIFTDHNGDSQLILFREHGKTTWLAIPKGTPINQTRRESVEQMAKVFSHGRKWSFDREI